MPVFARMKDTVLVLTVDGDYTPNELRRISVAAIQGAPEGTIPVLLDMSGAAGMARKSAQDLADTGAIFGVFRERIPGIAVVAPADTHPVFATDSSFARMAGVAVHPFVSHAEARAWLAGLRS